MIKQWLLMETTEAWLKDSGSWPDPFITQDTSCSWLGLLGGELAQLRNATLGLRTPDGHRRQYIAAVRAGRSRLSSPSALLAVASCTATGRPLPRLDQVSAPLHTLTDALSPIPLADCTRRRERPNTAVEPHRGFRDIIRRVGPTCFLFFLFNF